MRLILLRHGESTWNLENKFTGWKDVPLSKKGIEEANLAGSDLKKNNFKVISLTTSVLQRAIQTTKIVSSIVGFPNHQIVYDWKLNERHYGALQGLNKSETAAKYGEEQVHIWRRSYDIPPPLLDIQETEASIENKKLKDVKRKYWPLGESLKDVVERISPFWKKYMKKLILNPGDHLLVAHSNSLRAIIMKLEKMSSKEIISVNIPTGTPLVYDLDRDQNILNKYYLIDEKTLKQKQDLIINQGKVKNV